MPSIYLSGILPARTSLVFYFFIKGPNVEKTIELEIRSLLPGVESDQDSCIKRLEAALQNRREMQKAHLEKSDDGEVKLCLHYDSEKTSVSQVKRLAERAGVEIINRYKHEMIPIHGMDCSDCAIVVEHSLGRMDGVLTARVNYAAKKLWIEYDTHSLTHRGIEKRIQSLGYEIPLEGPKKWLKENQELLMSLASGLLLLIGWVSEQFLGLPTMLSWVFYIIANVIGGWEIAQHAFHALKERHFDTDLLMVMAALGAAALGDFAEGVLLIFLFSLGHALEERALEKARSAIEALADLTPKTALVRRDGAEMEIPVEQLMLKDIVIVRPGTRIAIDGSILTGGSGVDQSPVTGESIPVDKSAGDPVFAGTINGEGALEVSVTRLAADSTLSRVMKMVEEAQGQKSPTQQTMERFERIFVPGVLIVTALVIIIPPFFGAPFRESFLRAMTLLVAASPCAMALGTPASVLAGIAQAARNGVLIKGGAHLESLGMLKAIAFDKTGTITHGKPEVTEVIAFHPEIFSENQVLALAGALESQSMHPLAKAIVRAGQSRSLQLPKIGPVTSLTGRGLRSSLDGKTIILGSPKLISEARVDVSPEIVKQVETSEENGKTTVLISVGGSLAGLISLADTLRPEIEATLKQLQDLGIEKTAILTGDNARVAAAMSRKAGFTDYYADLMPKDKAMAIQNLVKKFGVVAMVGDGVNDAPALAYATVGIAMGGAGTDVALETADVALMSDNLQKLPFAVGLGRATRRIILQNLAIALGVIAILVVASLAGWTGIGVAILFHEGSTILVVLNALRLLGYRG
jgi:Zn2+/Cd2+-exporting ATPase